MQSAIYLQKSNFFKFLFDINVVFYKNVIVVLMLGRSNSSIQFYNLPLIFKFRFLQLIGATMKSVTVSLGDNQTRIPQINKPFWIVWLIELWERFGYYGVQAILPLYFVNQLGYSEQQSFYIFGSFTAFVYGFIWIGGWLGDHYLGAKRTLVIGAIILAISYAGLALADKNTIFYALAGIIVGNALFKANPSSLISKLYKKGDPGLDSAMTLYYMAINIGSMLSMTVTPFIAKYYSWPLAYAICSLGLFLGVGNYFIFRKELVVCATSAGLRQFSIKKFVNVLLGSIVTLIIIAQLLNHTLICNYIIYIVASGGFLYFFILIFRAKEYDRKRMSVALILILQSIAFFVLYNQMPTSLTFFAVHNIDNSLWGFSIPAAEYQVLNSATIIIMSPLLAWFYKRMPATHVTKFCLGMSFASLAYLVLVLPQYTAEGGLASPWWMVLTYYFQSVSELLISGLGLAMVAELCPRHMSGFAMGIWWLTSMLAGPLGARVGNLTAPSVNKELSPTQTMPIYSHVFLEIGLVVGMIAFIMWLFRPTLIRLLSEKIT